jgi:hypothetical protein
VGIESEYIFIDRLKLIMSFGNLDIDLMVKNPASRPVSIQPLYEAGKSGNSYDEIGPDYEKEKKIKRLSVEQTKSLETSFEMESKLGPERKMKLAAELRLEPRQVAVWYQNRRARWKAKQLEKDYHNLKQLYHTAVSEKRKLEWEVLRLTEELHAMKKSRPGPKDFEQISTSDDNLNDTLMTPIGTIDRPKSNNSCCSDAASKSKVSPTEFDLVIKRERESPSQKAQILQNKLSSTNDHKQTGQEAIDDLTIMSDDFYNYFMVLDHDHQGYSSVCNFDWPN